jgi:hypothetical protein
MQRQVLYQIIEGGHSQGAGTGPSITNKGRSGTSAKTRTSIHGRFRATRGQSFQHLGSGTDVSSHTAAQIKGADAKAPYLQNAVIEFQCCGNKAISKCSIARRKFPNH